MQALGWDLWPNQQAVAHQALPLQQDIIQEQEQNEQVPQLIPIPQNPEPEVVSGANLNILDEINQHAEEIDFNPQVIAMDELTDDSDGEALPPPLHIDPIEIVLPDFDNLQPIIHDQEDEVQYADLLGLPDINQNLQLGFVQIAQPQVDPVFSPVMADHQASLPNSEAFRLWIQFFSHNNPSLPSVVIPDSWMNFFVFLLLQSPTFDWAKDFLQSSAWSFFATQSGNSSVFTLPSSCPPFSLPACSNFEHTSSVIIEDLETESSQHQEHLNTPKRKRTPKVKTSTLNEADLRRSNRLKKINKGFKAKACTDKNCIGCSANPPIVSPKVIRDLGATFCDIDPNDLSDERLNAVPSKATADKGKAKSNKKAKSASRQSSSPSKATADKGKAKISKKAKSASGQSSSS